MGRSRPEREIGGEVQRVEAEPGQAGVGEIRIHTDRGLIRGVLHAAPGASGAAILVGGAGGGVTGPASIYQELAEELQRHGFTGLRLDYRYPAHLDECVYDTLAAIEALARQGVERVALVGWSFGGAVVITAGARSARVAGVATVASQSYGTEDVADLAPRPILLLHGSGDRTLTPACSRDIYARAGEPRELEIYPGANHGLDEVRDAMRQRLREWLLRTLA